jgi:hypothetical protein
MQSNLSEMLSGPPALLFGTGDTFWQAALDGGAVHRIYCRVAAFIPLLPLWLLGAIADT